MADVDADLDADEPDVDQVDDREPGSVWIIARFQLGFFCRLVAIAHKDWKPSLQKGWTERALEWMKWSSYHAAAKFRRENCLQEGSKILNLTQIEKLNAAALKCDRERRLKSD